MSVMVVMVAAMSTTAAAAMITINRFRGLVAGGWGAPCGAGTRRGASVAGRYWVGADQDMPPVADSFGLGGMAMVGTSPQGWVGRIGWAGGIDVGPVVGTVIAARAASASSLMVGYRASGSLAIPWR